MNVWLLSLSTYLLGHGGNLFVGATAKPSKEKLVISALVDYPNFPVLELTACSHIANLNSFNLYQLDGLGNLYNYTGAFLSNISPGTKIYVTLMAGTGFGLDAAGFQSFFGLSSNPANLFFSNDLQFFGSWDLQLLLGATMEDVYLGSTLTFASGWAQRKPGSSATSLFNASDWVATPGVYANAPITNSAATTPITFGTYTCRVDDDAPVAADVSTTAPTTAPTLAPVPLASENFVISALIDHPNFPLLELTACSPIANFNAYNFYQIDSFGNLYNYTGDFLSSISRGTKIYVTLAAGSGLGLDPTSFQSFFGLSANPTNLFFTNDLQFYGSWDLKLLQGATLKDLYMGTNLTFANGWAQRKLGSTATGSFDPNDWTASPGAYINIPATNSASPSPITLGTYTCACFSRGSDHSHPCPNNHAEPNTFATAKTTPPVTESPAASVKAPSP